MNFFNKTAINQLRERIFNDYQEQINVIKEFILACNFYKKLSRESHKKLVQESFEKLRNVINSISNDNIKNEIKNINIFSDSVNNIKDDVKVFVEDEFGFRFTTFDFDGNQLNDAVYKSDSEFESAKLELNNSYHAQILKTIVFNRIMEDRLIQIKTYFYGSFNLIFEKNNKSITYKLQSILNKDFDKFISLLDSNLFPLNLITESPSRILKDLDARLFYKRYSYYTELLNIYDMIDYALYDTTLVIRIRTRLENELKNKISNLESRIELLERATERNSETIYDDVD